METLHVIVKNNSRNDKNIVFWGSKEKCDEFLKNHLNNDRGDTFKDKVANINLPSLIVIENKSGKWFDCVFNNILVARIYQHPIDDKWYAIETEVNIQLFTNGFKYQKEPVSIIEKREQKNYLADYLEITLS